MLDILFNHHRWRKRQLVRAIDNNIWAATELRAKLHRFKSIDQESSLKLLNGFVMECHSDLLIANHLLFSFRKPDTVRKQMETEKMIEIISFYNWAFWEMRRSPTTFLETLISRRVAGRLRNVVELEAWFSNNRSVYSQQIVEDSIARSVGNKWIFGLRVIVYVIATSLMKVISGVIAASTVVVMFEFGWEPLWFPVSVLVAWCIDRGIRSWVLSNRVGTSAVASAILRFAGSMIMLYSTVGTYACVGLVCWWIVVDLY
jgi:hypothetical protein